MIHFMINENTDFIYGRRTGPKFRRIQGQRTRNINYTADTWDVMGDNEIDANIDKSFLKIDPDNLYNSDSTTFIYDQKKNTLYWAEYPITHGDILASSDYEEDGPNFHIHGDWGRETPVYELLGMRKKRYAWDRDDAKNAGYILGRVGPLENEPDQQHIGFWNEFIRKSDINKCLQALIKQFPWLVTEKDKVVVFSEYSVAFKPFLLKDAKINFPQTQTQRQGQQIDPRCKEASIVYVDGKPMDLGQILGNLHMVKGVNLERMKGAFCSAAPEIKRKLQQIGACEYQIKLVDEIIQKMDCKSGEELYHQLKGQGRRAYRDDMLKIFHRAGDAARSGEDSDPLGTQFRTQGELDAAFDSLFSKREHRFYSFKEWLKEKK